MRVRRKVRAMVLMLGRFVRFLTLMVIVMMFFSIFFYQNLILILNYYCYGSIR